MTDLVVGVGEIGRPIYDLLKMRNFRVEGYDPNIPEFESTPLEEKYEMIHICVPYLDEKQFDGIVKPYTYLTDLLIIHSTVAVGTSRRLGAIYSPIRGVHHDMLNCLRSFTKYYAHHEDLMEFEKRFPKCIRLDDSDKLERTKHVLVSRYAAEMALDRYFQKHYPYYRELTFELNEKYGILPIYYNDNKEFGGHCIFPNIEFLNDDFIKKIVAESGGS